MRPILFSYENVCLLPTEKAWVELPFLMSIENFGRQRCLKHSNPYPALNRPASVKNEYVNISQEQK